MREVLFHLGNSFLQIQRHEMPIREFGSAVVKATVSTVDPSLVCLHATRVVL